MVVSAVMVSEGHMGHMLPHACRLREPSLALQQHAQRPATCKVLTDQRELLCASQCLHGHTPTGLLTQA